MTSIEMINTSVHNNKTSDESITNINMKKNKCKCRTDLCRFEYSSFCKIIITSIILTAGMLLFMAILLGTCLYFGSDYKIEIESPEIPIESTVLATNYSSVIFEYTVYRNKQYITERQQRYCTKMLISFDSSLDPKFYQILYDNFGNIDLKKFVCVNNNVTSCSLATNLYIGCDESDYVTYQTNMLPINTKVTMFGSKFSKTIVANSPIQDLLNNKFAGYVMFLVGIGSIAAFVLLFIFVCITIKPSECTCCEIMIALCICG